MASEQMNALLAAVAADPQVAAKFTDVASADEAVAVAATLGFEVTAEEVEAVGAAVQAGELSDAELAAVSGAGSPTLENCRTLYGMAGCPMSVG